MIKLFFAFLFASIIFFSSFGVSEAYVRVRGYYRKSGTYVQPYYRSNSDGYKYNNWSTRGNTNPFTGRSGYKSLY